jgi:hypothetical protein
MVRALVLKALKQFESRDDGPVLPRDRAGVDERSIVYDSLRGIAGRDTEMFFAPEHIPQTISLRQVSETPRITEGQGVPSPVYRFSLSDADESD